MPNPAQECAKLIQSANSIVALTGAGISTSCGIPDFRGPQGLYVTRQYDPETVFDIHYFHQDPKPFFEFARDFIGLEQTLLSSFAHQFLALLEKGSKLKGVVTQNIDSLHQKAGSTNVLEIHGSFWRSHCMSCGEEYSYDEMCKMLEATDVPKCNDGGVIKPDIVFFGENVKRLDECVALAESADLFFVIGSSCVVQPAASLPYQTLGKIVVVNLEPVDLGMSNVVLQVNQDIDDFFQKVSEYLV